MPDIEWEDDPFSGREDDELWHEFWRIIRLSWSLVERASLRDQAYRGMFDSA